MGTLNQKKKGPLRSTKFPFGPSSGMAWIKGGLSASRWAGVVSSRRVKSEGLGWNRRHNPALKLVCAKHEIKKGSTFWKATGWHSPSLDVDDGRNT